MVFILSLIINLTFLNTTSEDIDTILIINSYNESYNWTQETMNGILDHLDDKHHIYIEYLDGKNYSSDDDIENFNQYMTYKYKDKSFDMIISTDDLAFQYALKHQDTLFKGAPIFFTGVNSLNNYDTNSFTKVFGVEEKVSAKDTLEVIKNLQGEITKIHFIVDDTESGQLTISEIKKQIGADVEIEFYNQYSLNEITDKISRLDNPSEVILLAYFIVDQDMQFLDTDIMTKKITEIAPIPVYGLYYFSFNYGIIGGNLISGYEQGVKITEIIDKYKKGYLNNFYYESKEANQHYYDYEAIKKYGLDPNKLPKDAILVNKPISFYEENKVYILATMFVLLLLIIYIITLRDQVSRQIKKQSILMRQLATSDKMASLGEMMSRISHELNTPLGNITTTNSYLDKTITDLDESVNNNKLSMKELKKDIETLKHSSNIIDESITKAVELMSAFRIFSEHTTDKSFRKFDLADYLNNLIKTYHPLLINGNHKCILQLEEPLIIIGKTRNYYKIFDQLIRNTIQHGFNNLKNKEFYINIKIEKRMLIIQYSDNGNGIPEEDMPHLFKPLYKFKNKNTPTLGLSTVYKLVSEMNGTISCESKLDQGTSFYIHIPLHKEQA